MLYHHLLILRHYNLSEEHSFTFDMQHNWNLDWVRMENRFYHSTPFQVFFNFSRLPSTVCGAEWLMISCSATHQRLSFPVAISKISTRAHTRTQCIDKYSYISAHIHREMAASASHFNCCNTEKGEIWGRSEKCTILSNPLCGLRDSVL